MSWTADRDRAEWFQHRFDLLGTVGRLWTITVGPDRLLAHYHVQHRRRTSTSLTPLGYGHTRFSHHPQLRGDERCR